MERRDLAHRGYSPQLREDAAGRKKLVGYAAVFFREGDVGSEYTLYQWPGLRAVEHLMPGCFSSALARPDDVRCLRDHDPSLLLGRTASGTCRLSVDSIGLRYECDLPKTSYAEDVKESLARGDLSGSSFSFDIVENTTRELRQPDGTVIEILEIRDLKLYDVSCVSYPAYKSTSAGLRGQQHARKWTPAAKAARAAQVQREFAGLGARSDLAPRISDEELAEIRAKYQRGRNERAIADMDREREERMRLARISRMRAPNRI